MRASLSKLGLGASQIQTGGGQRGRSADVELREMLTAAARAGIGFVDAGSATAAVEQLLGAALPRPPAFRLLVKSVRGDRGPDHVEAELRASLSRLRVAQARAVVVQSASDLFAPSGAALWDRLKALRDQGLVEQVGVSVYASDDPAGLARRFQPAKIYARLGSLEVRLARKRSEIRRAQRLRYKVFYEEMSAVPGALAMLSRRDEDAFDAVFDHLLVIDRGDPNDGRRWRPSKVVGTYRVLRQEVADLYDGFYTQGEYDIAPLIEAKPDYSFMELGRSCVLKPYRNRRTLELLWQGVWSYVREHGVDVMLGCASFEGIDPKEHAEALSFLYHTALAPEDWRVTAHRHLRADMNMMPRERINARRAFKALPPLIKGYLRLGAYIGDGAVIDHQFGTTDVLIILPVEAIRTRYFAHFGAPDEPASAVVPQFAQVN